MKHLASAISFLTIIPTQMVVKIGPEDFTRMPVYFPAVGLMIGAMLCVLSFISSELIANSYIISTLVVLAETVITRALHIDGFSDFIDGIIGGKSKEEKLKIMSDPHIGVFGVTALIFLFILKIETLGSIGYPYFYFTLLVMPTLSRWVILFPMLRTQYAKDSGLGKTMRISRISYTLITIFSLVVAVFFLEYSGLAIMAILFCSILYINSIVKRGIGGMTGDVYGFMLEFSEIETLIMVAIIFKFIPLLL